MHMRVFSTALLIVAVSSMRLQPKQHVKQHFDLPPELLDKLSEFLSDENLPRLLEQVPEQQRELVEKFAPLMSKQAPAIIETVMAEMSSEQQEKIKKVVEAVTSDKPPENLNELVEELVEDVGSTVRENIDNPDFIGKLVGTVAQDGDSLKEVLQAIMGPSQAGMVGPLIDFMSVDGTPVFANLDSIQKTGAMMDGPLRTLFLLSNMLAYSTSLGEAGSTFGPEAVDGKKAYPVVDGQLKEKTGIKWLLPQQWTTGIDLICAVLKLKLTRLEIQEDILSEAEAEDKPGSTLFTVRMSLQTTSEESSRALMVHSVRTGVGSAELANANDLYLLMGLYEEPIRKSLGVGGITKYLSLADIVYKLGQSVTQWDWLMEKIGQENNTLVQDVAGWDEKRKALRGRLAEGIKSTVAAEELSAEKDVVHLYTGMSLGGSIARAKAMVAKLDCEECPVVALTVNSPSIYKLVHKLELVPEDTRPWYDRWFSESIMEKKANLFTGFVNYVAQHGVFWKLDDPVPGTRTCMYMHAAELAGCRGVTHIGDLYTAFWSGLWNCRKDYVTPVSEGKDKAGLMGACMMEHLAPALQCVVQEHGFALTGHIGDITEMLSSESGLGALNATAVFEDIVATFSDFNQAQVAEDMGWLKSQTGYTVTVPLTADEAAQREADRQVAVGEIRAWLSRENAGLNDKYKKLLDDTEAEWKTIPSCTGCGAEWCAEKDVRQYRCCAQDESGACHKKEKYNFTESRTMCREDGSETCSGVGRWFSNMARRCMCTEGNCWNGARCAEDIHHEKRKALTNQTAELKDEWKLQLKNREYVADQKIAAYEAKVVKSVSKDTLLRETVADAKPDPALNKKWVCTR